MAANAGRSSDDHALVVLSATWRPPGSKCAGRCCFPWPAVQPCPRADGAGVRASERAVCRRPRHSQRRRPELRVRRHARCSNATSSPATTASKAARAPMSACAIPAPTTMAGAPMPFSANPTRLAARTPSPRPIWSMSAPIPGLETATSDYVGLFGFTTPNRPRRHRSAAVSTNRPSRLRRAELKAGLFGPAGFAEREIRLYPGPAALWLHDDRHEVTLAVRRTCARTGALFGFGHL